MNTSNERNYGIDLFRLVLMFLICLHHVIGQAGVISNSLIENKIVYSFIYVVTMIGVDGFALISGYVANGTKQRYYKIVEMWFQVFFYSFGIPLIINVLRMFSANESFALIEIVKGAFPVINHTYWYFDAYIVLFFFMPFINRGLDGLNKKGSKIVLYTILLLMMVMWLNNNEADHNFLSTGRSAFWLILMYVTGFLVKKSDFLNHINLSILVGIFIFLSVVSYLYVDGEVLSLSNIDPSVWISAIIMLIVFSRIRIKGIVVRVLSPLSFGIYLFHTNFYFRYYLLSERFLYSNNLNTIFGFLTVFGFAALIFIFGLFVDYIRTALFRKVGINKISKSIVLSIERIIEKAI